MDWSNQAHLTQALLVALAAFATFMGYRAGDKT
jgi:hypothetical protein